MFGKAFSWIRRFFELAGAIQTLGSVGGATVLAIVGSAALGAVLELPAVLLILLGVGIFFVALAVILAVLKAVLERRVLAATVYWNKWKNADLVEVDSKIFRNQEVVLDGHSYTNCQFVNVTFAFEGRQPFFFGDNNTVQGEGIGLRYETPAVEMWHDFLNKLGLMDTFKNN